MRCINCSDALNSMDNLLIDFNPEDYGLSINESNSYYKCSSCDEDILHGDYYFEDDEIDSIEEELCCSIAEVIGKSIDSCNNCGHGSEMSDLQAGLYMNFKENDEWEELYDNYNVCTELQNLIYDNCLIDEKYYDLIIDNIRCPNCGNGGGHIVRIPCIMKNFIDIQKSILKKMLKCLMRDFMEFIHQLKII